MDIITIAKRMNHRINALEKAREELASLAISKAEAISEYDKQLAITIIRIRNGMEVELEGKHITNPPVTIIEKIAKGVCWEQRLEADKADGLYKAKITEIPALQAELNGYQSVNKYIKEDIGNE